MENNKTNNLIASFLLILMFFIIFFGLFDRFDYEKNTKRVYLSANYEDLQKSGVDIANTLKEMKNAGVGYVTVSPVTFSEMKENNKFDAISYSSVKINEDDISQKIKAALKNSQISDDDVILISSREDVTAFLTENLIYRYDVVKKKIDDKIFVFCVKGQTKDSDFIIGYDNSEISLAKSSGLKLALSYPAFSFENSDYEEFFSGYLFKNSVDFLILRENKNENKVHLTDEFKTKLRSSETSLVVFENENQIKNEPAFIFPDMSEAFVTRTVRGFNMDKVLSYDKTGYRYRYYQWYNSLLERNTSFLNVNILKNEGKTAEENTALTLKAIKDLKEKTENMGYSLNPDSIDIPYRYNLRTASLCGGIAIVLLLYLYLTLLGISIKNPLTSVAFASVFSMVISYPLYDYITKFYAVIIMILTVSLYTLILFKTINSENSYKNKLIISLASFFALMLFGSFFITAMFSDLNFYLGNKWVFGVKISLILPFVTTAFNYNTVFLKIKSPKELLEKTKSELKAIPKYVLISGICVFSLVLLYYLIRTGKSDLILPIEDIIRKKLTDIFLIRPRFKEFLIGYPCFAIFLYTSLFRKNEKIRLASGILSTILFTSVLNTFCHAFTDFSVSLIRTFNGLILGIVVSGLIILISEITIRFIINKKSDEISIKDKLYALKKKSKDACFSLKEKLPKKKEEIKEVPKEKPQKTENHKNKQPQMKNKPQTSKKKGKKKKKKKK